MGTQQHPQNHERLSYYLPLYLCLELSMSAIPEYIPLANTNMYIPESIKSKIVRFSLSLYSLPGDTKTIYIAPEGMSFSKITMNRSFMW